MTALQNSPPFVPPFPAHTLASLGGLQLAGVRAGIKASGNPDVAVLVFDQPTSASVLTTQNKLAAAPVLLTREHMRRNKGKLRALVINSGNANAATGKEGLLHAAYMCARVAERIGCASTEVAVCSTGVIGVPLPIEKVLAGIDGAIDGLGRDEDHAASFLEAIMTTDAFPKAHGLASGKRVTAGICKGAGMIEPNMATMLAFVGTNASLSPAELKSAMPAIASKSFNAVHVDSHQSTNDTFVAFATGTAKGGAAAKALKDVSAVAEKLAWMIARDGEGATKVTTIAVRGAQSDDAARAVAKSVAHSALVRTALFGNDPNWGRIASQVANTSAAKNCQAMELRIANTLVFRRGQPVPFDRAAVSQAMRAEDLAIDIKLADGKGQGRCMTSDLGYRYVEVNAEYTT